MIDPELSWGVTCFVTFDFLVKKKFLFPIFTNCIKVLFLCGFLTATMATDFHLLDFLHLTLTF